MNPDCRKLLLELLQSALRAVHGRHCVRAALMADTPHTPVHLVAIGKAAAAMTLGAMDVLGQGVRAGLVISKSDHLEPELERYPQLSCFEAGHPVPDARSLTAGEALLRFLAEAPEDVEFLFLISGGASALVEVPADDLSLAELQRVNGWLIGSGLEVSAMNRVRKRLSRIKGGGLLAYLGRHRSEGIMISDVPGDVMGDIGSGLLVATADGPLPSLPDWLDELLARVPVRAESGPADAMPRLHVVASLKQAMEAAAADAIDSGERAWLHGDGLRGDAATAGRELAAKLLAASPGIHIWGGETVVDLPPEPGQGGRNQALALAAATVLSGSDKAWLLAVGTDGSDGPGSDAGAVVDGHTLRRGADAGLDAEDCLRRADAGSFLAASGDLVSTGPTGTNVMDIVIGLRLPDEGAASWAR